MADLKHIWAVDKEELWIAEVTTTRIFLKFSHKLTHPKW